MGQPCPLSASSKAWTRMDLNDNRDRNVRLAMVAELLSNVDRCHDRDLKAPSPGLLPPIQAPAGWMVANWSLEMIHVHVGMVFGPLILRRAVIRWVLFGPGPKLGLIVTLLSHARMNGRWWGVVLEPKPTGKLYTGCMGSMSWYQGIVLIACSNMGWKTGGGDECCPWLIPSGCDHGQVLEKLLELYLPTTSPAVEINSRSLVCQISKGYYLHPTQSIADGWRNDIKTNTPSQRCIMHTGGQKTRVRGNETDCRRVIAIVGWWEIICHILLPCCAGTPASNHDHHDCHNPKSTFFPQEPWNISNRNGNLQYQLYDTSLFLNNALTGMLYVANRESWHHWCKMSKILAFEGVRDRGCCWGFDCEGSSNPSQWDFIVIQFIGDEVLTFSLFFLHSC